MVVLPEAKMSASKTGAVCHPNVGRYTPYTARMGSPKRIGSGKLAPFSTPHRKAHMAIPITPVKLGDVVKLKKPHPCGVNEWEIVRVGADIGLRCCGCDRRVMLVRSEFDRRFRGFLGPSDDSES
jgi:hypothetical protein